MGKVFNSFKGQIGRDAGKVFSNIVWGDKHSAPYRRVNNSTSTSRIRERRRANSSLEHTD